MTLQQLANDDNGNDSDTATSSNNDNETADDNGGTSAASGMVTASNTIVAPGAHIDFNGRNFGHEESVVVTMGGTTVATAHADGGGNFSTGSITIPMTTGSQTYTFTGQNSGTSATVTIIVQ